MGRGWVAGKKRRGASRFFGVYRMRGRWRVCTYLNGENCFWGSYKTEEDAARRYNKIVTKENGLPLNILEEDHAQEAV